MTNVILDISSVIIFLAVGVFCLFRARQLQNYALRYYERNPEEAKWFKFPGYVKSPIYVTVTRIIGGMTIVMGLFLAAVLIWFR